jgi:hypothetical protein
MASKSDKQRALYRSREEAKANGALAQWYAARDAERTAPAVPFKSPERLAWENAYSGPEVGPVGGSWPEDGRHVPRMVWRLPYNTGSQRPTPPRN